MLKRYITFIFLSVILIVYVPLYAKNREIHLYINQKKIDTSMISPVMIHNRVLVPVRLILENMGASVHWVKETKEVVIYYHNDIITMKIGETIIKKNNIPHEMDVAATIMNQGSTMVPLRALSQLMDYEVKWDPVSYSVHLLSVEEEFYVEDETIKKPKALLSVNSIIEQGTDFVIGLSEANAVIEDFVMEQKIIIDIKNAMMKIPSPIKTKHSQIVSVRFSQFQNEPPVSRIVFDLKHAVSYEIIKDNKEIRLKILPSKVENLFFETQNQEDCLQIYHDFLPAYQVYVMRNPNRLVIDLKQSQASFEEGYIKQGNFVENIRYSQFDHSTVRIVLDLKKEASFKTEEKNNNLLVYLKEPSYKNIRYEYDQKMIVLQKPPTAYHLQTEERLEQNEVCLRFNSDLEQHFGFGQFFISDEEIEAVEIKKNSANQQELIIKLKKIRHIDCYEDDNYIYVTHKNPRDVFSNILVIDPGHGGKDPGASGNGLVEKNINLKLANLLAQQLKSTNIKVYLTRTGDTNPSWDDRTYRWDFTDLYISLHANGNLSELPKGTEVLYTNNPLVNDYGLSSKKFANQMQKNLIKALKTNDRGIVERPKLIVLNRATYPAILIELAFLSNPEDAHLLKNDSFLQQAASVIAETVIELFSEHQTRP